MSHINYNSLIYYLIIIIIIMSILCYFVNRESFTTDVTNSSPNEKPPLLPFKISEMPFTISLLYLLSGIKSIKELVPSDMPEMPGKPIISLTTDNSIFADSSANLIAPVQVPDSNLLRDIKYIELTKNTDVSNNVIHIKKLSVYNSSNNLFTYQDFELYDQIAIDISNNKMSPRFSVDAPIKNALTLAPTKLNISYAHTEPGINAKMIFALKYPQIISQIIIENRRDWEEGKQRLANAQVRLYDKDGRQVYKTWILTGNNFNFCKVISSPLGQTLGQPLDKAIGLPIVQPIMRIPFTISLLHLLSGINNINTLIESKLLTNTNSAGAIGVVKSVIINKTDKYPLMNNIKYIELTKNTDTSNNVIHIKNLSVYDASNNLLTYQDFELYEQITIDNLGNKIPPWLSVNAPVINALISNSSVPYAQTEYGINAKMIFALKNPQNISQIIIENRQDVEKDKQRLTNTKVRLYDIDGKQVYLTWILTQDNFNICRGGEIN